MSKTNELRVISGWLKGAKILSPNTNETHPMGSREKLALFNMVNVFGGRVLDLYAGSGALGIEAISRGATEVKFVDNFAPAILTIKSNLQQVLASSHTVKQPNVQVVHAKVETFLQEASDYQNYFNVVFADPPYDRFTPADLEKVANVLTSAGTFVLSSPARLPEIAFSGLEIVSTRTYAAARLTIYRKIN